MSYLFQKGDNESLSLIQEPVTPAGLKIKISSPNPKSVGPDPDKSELLGRAFRSRFKSHVKSGSSLDLGLGHRNLTQISDLSLYIYNKHMKIKI